MFTIKEAKYEGSSIPLELKDITWDIAILGEQNLDQRSMTGCEFSKKNSKESFRLSYSSDNLGLSIDDTCCTYGVLRERLRNCKSLLIEATSLHCPEIMNILRCVIELKITQISFLYLEPIEYRKSIKGTLSESRSFDLSSNSRFQSIHGFMTNLSDLSPGQAVFFLGFEKARLAQAFEQQEALQQWQSHAVIGVPAFQPAWEIDTLSNNINNLASREFIIRYCSASSVKAAHLLLSNILNEDKIGNSIIVAPLGTKPHTIAASLFVAEHNTFDRAVLLFDHPQRIVERSKDIKRWHLYNVFFN